MCVCVTKNKPPPLFGGIIYSVKWQQEHVHVTVARKQTPAGGAAKYVANLITRLAIRPCLNLYEQGFTARVTA